MVHDKQITVFGGTGFIGRYLVDRLCDLGFTVRIPSRRPKSAYFLRTAGLVGQVVPIACNIRDDKSVYHAIAGSVAVINLVGTLTEKGRNQTFDALHHEFPARLALMAKTSGVERLVHLAALGADENAPSHYARSKAAGEKAVLENFPDATILRPSIVFGPEDDFFNRFARMALISPVLPLIDGGKTLFQPVYVEDVVKAIVTVVTTTTHDVKGQIYELGSEDQYSFRELMEKILEQMRQKRRLVNVTFGLARFKGAILQRLPGQLLTVDQVDSLTADNILSGAKPGLKDLGITPTPLDAILPGYMKRYRAGGRFGGNRAA